MTFIGLEPSTQLTSSGSCIGNVGEAALCQDTANRLVPKLQAAGHKVQIFAGSQDANSDGAYALVAAHPNIAFSLHLDSAGGKPGALLCYQEQRSLAMGLTVLNVYCQQMGIANKGSMLRTPGVNGVAVIRIPEAAGIPTALIEMGDMDCPDGTHWLDGNYREKAARAMCIAICAVVGGTIPPPVVGKEKEESMYYSGPPYASADGKSFEFTDCYQLKFKYCLKTIGNATNLVFTLIAKDGTTHKTATQDVSGQREHFLDVLAAQKPITGSFIIQAHSDTPIKWGLREEVR